MSENIAKKSLLSVIAPLAITIILLQPAKALEIKVILVAVEALGMYTVTGSEGEEIEHWTGYCLLPPLDPGGHTRLAYTNSDEESGVRPPGAAPISPGMSASLAEGFRARAGTNICMDICLEMHDRTTVAHVREVLVQLNDIIEAAVEESTEMTVWIRLFYES